MLAIGRCGKRSSQNERRSKPQISCKTSSCPIIFESKKVGSVWSCLISALGTSGLVIEFSGYGFPNSLLAFPNPQAHPQRFQQLSAHLSLADCLAA